ncbi:MAG: hypothetical protein R3314_14385 [Longimicrobiales bacterium]|nr:hypothetical protein [Longimicrobiales bacterium]
MNAIVEGTAVPARALVLSSLALTIPIVDVLTGGGAPDKFEALVWMSALLPAFLLAHYRHWTSMAVCLAFAVLGLTAVQFYLMVTGQTLPPWPYVLAAIGAIFALSVLATVIERARTR